MKTLFWLQIALIGGVLFLSAVVQPRAVLHLASAQGNVPLEFRAATLSLADVALGALALVTLLRLVAEGAYRRRFAGFAAQAVMGPGKWWMLLFLWMAATSLYALDGTLAAVDLVLIVLVFLLCLTLADLIRHEPASRAPTVIILIVSGILFSVIALGQALNRNPLGLWALGEVERAASDTSAFYRAPALTSHPNQLGGYLLVALAAVLVAIYNLRGTRWRLPLLLVGGLLLAGMVTTLSRSAALGLGVMGFSVLVSLWPNLPFALRRQVISISMIAIVVGSAWALGLLAADPVNIYERTFAPREFFFDQAWPVIQDHPVSGVGAGNLMLAVGPGADPTLELLLPVRNVYLYVLGESGLIGLVLFVMGCLSLLRRRNEANPYSLMFTSALLGACVIGFFDNYFWAVHPFRAYFFCLLGVCLGGVRVLRSNSPLVERPLAWVDG
jgi:O-antigen ligase